MNTTGTVDTPEMYKAFPVISCSQMPVTFYGSVTMHDFAFFKRSNDRERFSFQGNVAPFS